MGAGQSAAHVDLCISQGASREAAIVNIREAIEGYVLCLEDGGIEVPVDHFEALLLAV